MVVFESPFRVKTLLESIEEVSPGAMLVCGREMTKMYEEFIRGDVQTVRTRLAEKEPKGEFVVVIDPTP